MDNLNNKNEKCNITNKDLTILVVSYDGARELWSPFSQAWNQNWPDCTLEKVLVTQDVTSFSDNCFDRIISVSSKAPETIYRIKEALKQIQSKYVLVMCDDYFLYDTPHISKLLQIINIMELHKISCVHLENRGTNDKALEFVEVKNDNFLISGGVPSIYEKEFIYMLCEKFSDCTMREWELNASRWLRQRQYGIKIIRNSSFRCYHCVLEGYWRMKPYLWTKRKKIEVCYNTYKKPNLLHSIWAVGKAACFNLVLYCFPKLYASWSKRKYAESADNI